MVRNERLIASNFRYQLVKVTSVVPAAVRHSARLNGVHTTCFRAYYVKGMHTLAASAEYVTSFMTG